MFYANSGDLSNQKHLKTDFAAAFLVRLIMVLCALQHELFYVIVLVRNNQTKEAFSWLSNKVNDCNFFP